MEKRSGTSSISVWRSARVAMAAVGALLLSYGTALAHSPNVDASLTDWCIGATSNTALSQGRTEDSGVELTCGTCSGVGSNRACRLNSDCPAGQSCVNLTSKTETAFWDNRTDGAVNDLATVAMTQDATNLYISAELWVDPDPVSLPFGEIAIDFKGGGVGQWHDPNNLMRTPGRCSAFTDRACTTNADCAFCQISDEPTGGCSITTTRACVNNANCPGGETCVRRVRPCGSACDPGIGDVCNTSQTCVGLGPRTVGIGNGSNPQEQADFLLLFDFSLWLVSAGDAVQVMRPRIAGDPADPTTPWIPVTGCPPDSVGDNTNCDFPPAVNPGASGGSGGPPGAVEVAIPWTAFAGTGFGPNVPFRFTMTIARGSLTLDFKPDGAHEDVLSEPIAQTTSTTTNNCPGMGAGVTTCELANGSADAYIMKNPPLAHETVPGGRINGLTVNKAGLPSIALNWLPSCSTGDTDYEVYEGTIGTWYSHLPVNCATGATSLTFAAASGNQYYLVVPRTAGNEGSYGVSTGQVQRPVSTSACVPQSIGNCP